MPFAAAVSEHPVTAHAAGEVAGQLLDQLGGERPDLLTIFVTRPHLGALEDVAATLDTLLSPAHLMGATAVSVVAGDREVEEAAAVVAWAGTRMGPLRTLHLRAHRGPFGREGADARAILGWPSREAIDFVPQALLLLADPYSFPVDTLLTHLERTWPGLPVIGGMASAAYGPGGNRLAGGDTLDGTRISAEGAVGVLVGPGVDLHPVVSQGCRPVGQPFVVTRASGNHVQELGGRSAMQRLLDLAEGELTEREIQIINQGGLHLGVVIDEHKVEFGTGDFLVRNVLGADQETGSIEVSDRVEVGTTVQYHVRDAIAADQDLRELLSGQHGHGALVFTCNGRGKRLFGTPHHDAALVAEVLGAGLSPGGVPSLSPALAGLFAAGEIGPIGRRNFVHGFTASIALFSDRNPDGQQVVARAAPPPTP